MHIAIRDFTALFTANHALYGRKQAMKQEDFLQMRVRKSQNENFANPWFIRLFFVLYCILKVQREEIKNCLFSTAPYGQKGIIHYSNW